MFKEKVVIITGASSGIGRSLAIEFAKQGAILVIAARNIENLKITYEKCQVYGVDPLIMKTDVSVVEECQRLIETTKDHFNKIDILINNAGVSMRALFNEVDIKVMKTIMDVNFWGSVYCTKFALPYLIESKGSLVGISSVAGYRGLPARSGYSSSKFALNGFLETVRTENYKKGLHVLIAAPGFTSTNIRNTAFTKDGSVQAESPIDESKLMCPEKVAEKILKAINKKRKKINFTLLGKGTILANKFCPILMDKIVYNVMSRENDSPLK